MNSFYIRQNRLYELLCMKIVLFIETLIFLDNSIKIKTSSNFFIEEIKPGRSEAPYHLSNNLKTPLTLFTSSKKAHRPLFSTLFIIQYPT